MYIQTLYTQHTCILVYTAHVYTRTLSTQHTCTYKHCLHSTHVYKPCLHSTHVYKHCIHSTYVYWNTVYPAYMYLQTLSTQHTCTYKHRLHSTHVHTNTVYTAHMYTHCLHSTHVPTVYTAHIYIQTLFTQHTRTYSLHSTHIQTNTVYTTPMYIQTLSSPPRRPVAQLFYAKDITRPGRETVTDPVLPAPPDWTSWTADLPMANLAPCSPHQLEGDIMIIMVIRLLFAQLPQLKPEIYPKMGKQVACAAVSWHLQYFQTFKYSDARHSRSRTATWGISIMESVMKWRLLQLNITLTWDP